ncbi:MAG TPA: bifunctional (p)ppGpp synthetase/guanosine-3',5'-bis(diphosphate) 3'-pyrophosphohydrolase, partial [Candidatus Aphodomorpha intestinavium]|nr:bifunctional (p)ppGpp synthetase/guanosine-3',5'-bis(diphosphate) 3'-pyrophosphohydrolase [Candidatus Aphodomorpha intestinavium]
MEAAELLEKFRARYAPEQAELFEKALRFAEDAHHNQRRESGEPYIIHPVAVADIVMNMGMDAASVTAAVLHDAVEDGVDVTIEDVQKQFGEEIAHLVDGVTKLTISGKQTYITKKQEQAENLRK